MNSINLAVVNDTQTIKWFLNDHLVGECEIIDTGMYFLDATGKILYSPQLTLNINSDGIWKLDELCINQLGLWDMSMLNLQSTKAVIVASVVRLSEIGMNEYQREAAKTNTVPTERMAEYLALGLVGEAGEIANKVKKNVRGDEKWSDLTAKEAKKALIGELGDVMWYLSELARHIGVTLDEVAIANIDKLADRMERGQIKGDGDER